jgi:hypothetical protein
MYGPFVMNTRQEVVEAFDDFRAGRLGSSPPCTSPTHALPHAASGARSGP